MNENVEFVLYSLYMEFRDRKQGFFSLKRCRIIFLFVRSTNRKESSKTTWIKVLSWKIFLYIINRQDLVFENLIKIDRIVIETNEIVHLCLVIACLVLLHANVCFDSTNNLDIPKVNVSEEVVFHGTLVMIVTPTTWDLVNVETSKSSSYYLQLNLSILYFIDRYIR